ncbi:MAG: hypothetical protein J5844_00690 [Clostridia bacterium]|nr:hypothetical protein [Clostridia bacterium]
MAKKPIRLWGLSLLAAIVGFFAGLLTAPFLSLVGIGFAIVVSAGMSKVYLDALDNKEINSDQLFAGFKRMWTVLGGMAWKALWLFIWLVGSLAVGGLVMALFAALGVGFGRAAGVFSTIGIVLGVIVMLAGFVCFIIKTYAYKFVPYILMTREDVSATQALRLSVQLTRGKKGAMFLADLLFGVIVGVASGILAALSAIPYIGGIFAIVLVLFVVIVMLFSEIFQGLYNAAFYQMPAAPAPAQQNQFANQFQQFQQQYQQPQQPQYQPPQQQYQQPQQPPFNPQQPQQ